MRARISFVGAGPGAADLITVRGARRISESDVVIWTASLVAPECVQEHARADAELIDSSRLSHEESVEIYRRAERDRLKVARVHPGDTALWGGVQDQYDACARMDVEVEIVPGVATFSAASAAVGQELTTPGATRSVVLTRLEGGRTPVVESERVREFAQHGTTLALFLSAARTAHLVEELRAGGYEDDVPVVIAYKVSWPDELLLRTTLGELEKTVKQHRLWRHTLFLVGTALGESGHRRPRSGGYAPGYRRADPSSRRTSRAEHTSSRRERGGVSRDGGGSESDPVPVVEVMRASGQPDSGVAWWAVRNWQETARGAARVAAARAASAGRRAVKEDAAQSDLFAHNTEVPDTIRAEPFDTAEGVGEPSGSTVEVAHPKSVDSTAEAAVPEPEAHSGERAESATTGEDAADAGKVEQEAAKAAPKRRSTSAATKPKASGAKTKNPTKSTRGKTKSGAQAASARRASSREQGNASEQG
jgi:precorrin-4 C11-methyltransferase